MNPGPVERWWRERRTGTLEHGTLEDPSARVSVGTGGGIVLRGTVLPLDEPLEIDYRVEADDEWRTRRVSVNVVDTESGERRHIEFHADGAGAWTVHDEQRPDLLGCVDVDLAFSPITNTLPIRRLELAVGASADVDAVWVQWPSLEVSVLRQSYQRTSRDRYLYSCGSFSAALVVDEHGLVADYEGGWEVVEPG